MTISHYDREEAAVHHEEDSACAGAAVSEGQLRTVTLRVRRLRVPSGQQNFDEECERKAQR